MADFKSKKIDMDINLTTLDGTEVKLIFKEKLSVTVAEKIYKRFKEYEAKCDEMNKEKPRSVLHHQQLATELTFFYPEHKAEWFKDNVDPETMQSMIIFLSQGLAGLKKRGES